MLMLLVDMVVTDDQGRCNIYGPAADIRACLILAKQEPFQIQCHDTFQILELIFLSFFGVEILLRLYAYGFAYLMDVLNLVDAVIVFSLLIVQIILSTALSGQDASSFSFLRIWRLLRLVRLFVVMNKVQKAQRARTRRPSI